MILDRIVICSVWLDSKDGAYDVCLALPTYFRLLFIATFLMFMLFNLHGFEWKTDYSVAGSPLKTLIRGEEHFFHIMILFQLCAGDCLLPSGFANLLLFGSPMRTLKW